MLRAHYDSEWAQYTAGLTEAAAAGRRQARLSRLVRLLWLSFDAQVDGLRLLSLAAGVVKSSESSPAAPPLSFLHAAPASSSSPHAPCWPLQAAHLCVLCLSKLTDDSGGATGSTDRRVSSLLLAVVTLLLDHGRWQSAALSSQEERAASAAQHAQLLRCLCSPQSRFFPVLHRVLLGLSGSERPQSALVAALLSALLRSFASSAADGDDAFALHMVTAVLTVPAVASALCSPAVLPLCSPALLSRIVTAALRLATSAAESPVSPQLPSSGSGVPSLALLLGNVVQLLDAALDWRRAELQLLLPLLRLLPVLLQPLPRQLFAEEKEERRTAWTFAAPDARKPAALIRLPAMSLAAAEGVSAAEHERRREAVVRQLRPLLSVSFFTSLLQRAFIVPAGQAEEDDSLRRLLTAFSLPSSASAAGSEALMPAFASFPALRARVHAAPRSAADATRLSLAPGALVADVAHLLQPAAARALALPRGLHRLQADCLPPAPARHRRAAQG